MLSTNVERAQGKVSYSHFCKKTFEQLNNFHTGLIILLLNFMYASTFDTYIPEYIETVKRAAISINDLINRMQNYIVVAMIRSVEFFISE